MNFYHIKNILYLVFIISLISLPHISRGETNIEYFFGNNTSKYKDVVVSKVISSDTFILESGEVIKLIGLKAPETPRREKRTKRDRYGFVIKEDVSPLINIEEEALKFARELLEGKHVRLEFDANKKDSQNRTLAYAYLIENNILANTEILRRGYAHLQIRIPNKKKENELRAAYQEARAEKRGLQNR